jgi:hypothetical protein
MATPHRQFHALVCLGGVGQDEVQRHLRALNELEAVTVAGAWPLIADDGAPAYVVHLVHEGPAADAVRVRASLRIATAASGVAPKLLLDVVGFAVAVGR